MIRSRAKTALALTALLSAASTSYGADLPILGDLVGGTLPEIGLASPESLIALGNLEGNVTTLQGLATKGLDILGGGSVPLVGSFENAIVLGTIVSGEIVENNINSGNLPLIDDLLGGALTGSGGLPLGAGL